MTGVEVADQVCLTLGQADKIHFHGLRLDRTDSQTLDLSAQRLPVEHLTPRSDALEWMAIARALAMGPALMLAERCAKMIRVVDGRVTA